MVFSPSQSSSSETMTYIPAADFSRSHDSDSSSEEDIGDVSQLIRSAERSVEKTIAAVKTQGSGALQIVQQCGRKLDRVVSQIRKEKGNLWVFIKIENLAHRVLDFFCSSIIDVRRKPSLKGFCDLGEYFTFKFALRCCELQKFSRAKKIALRSVSFPGYQLTIVRKFLEEKQMAVAVEYAAGLTQALPRSYAQKAIVEDLLAGGKVAQAQELAKKIQVDEVRQDVMVALQTYSSSN